MAEITLEVTRRETTGKEVAKKLRKDGKVPAVVYGGHREPGTAWAFLCQAKVEGSNPATLNIFLLFFSVFLFSYLFYYNNLFHNFLF